MITAAELLEVGATGKTHGVGGEVACQIDVDFDWEQCRYFVFDMDGIFVPFFIGTVRDKNAATKLVKFLDIDDEASARKLCNKTIYIDKTLAANSEQLALDYFVGFTVIDQKLGTLGTIDAVDDSTANALFAIGDRLIPVCEEFICDIDHAHKTLHTALPEGLFTL